MVADGYCHFRLRAGSITSSRLLPRSAMSRWPWNGAPAPGTPDRPAVPARAQGDDAGQCPGGHTGLVRARLLGDLAPHEVADGGLAGPDGGGAREGDGLGEQAGVGDPVRRRVEFVHLRQGLPVTGLAAGQVDVAVEHEGGGAVERLRQGADDVDRVRDRVDLLDRRRGRHGRAGTAPGLTPEGEEVGAEGHDGRVAHGDLQGGGRREVGAVHGGQHRGLVGGAVVAADEVDGPPDGDGGEVGAGLRQPAGDVAAAPRSGPGTARWRRWWASPRRTRTTWRRSAPRRRRGRWRAATRRP